MLSPMVPCHKQTSRHTRLSFDQYLHSSKLKTSHLCESQAHYFSVVSFLDPGAYSACGTQSHHTHTLVSVAQMHSMLDGSVQHIVKAFDSQAGNSNANPVYRAADTTRLGQRLHCEVCVLLTACRGDANHHTIVECTHVCLSCAKH